MLEKCPKIGVRSYARDNLSEKRISRVYYTSELRFWGVFLFELWYYYKIMIRKII